MRARIIVILVAVVIVASTLSGRQNPPNTAGRHATLARLIEEGQKATKAGNPKLALTHFGEAVPLAEAIGEPRQLVSALSGLGWGQWGSGQYDAALASRKRALDVARPLDDAALLSTVLMSIGESYYSQARYDDALAHYRLALDANQREPLARHEGLILSNMGSAYRAQGGFSEAAAVLEQALGLLRAAGERADIAQVLTFLGIVCRASGEFDRALGYYEEAIASRRGAGDRRGEAQAIGNMANVYLDIGQYDRAIELNRQSLAIAEEIGYAVQVGFAQQNLGAALSRVPRAQEALTSYDAALATFRRIGRRAQIPYALHNIGRLRGVILDDRPGARSVLLEALDAAREIADREAEAYVLHSLGSVEMLSGRLPNAIERFDAALRNARDLGLGDLEYVILAERGEASFKHGRLAAAIDDLRASAAIVNDVRANVSSDQSKIAYVDTRQAVFQMLAALLATAGRTDEALEAAESGRARAFADLLLQRQVRGRPADQAALRSVRLEIAEPARPAPGSPSGPGNSSRSAAGGLGTALDRLRAQNRELASLMTVESPKADEIRSIAARLHATIVEYLVTDRTLLTWVVSPSGRIEFVQQPTGGAELRRLIESARAGLDAPTAAALRRPGTLDPPLKALHRMMIEPIARWLPAASAQPVIIVPHGPSALVPFAALKDARGVPVVERFTIAMAPSISIFRYTPDKRRRTAGSKPLALVVADPVPPSGSGLERLPGTIDEGRRVAARLGTGTRLMSAGAATESAIKQAMTGPAILHFATHGLVSHTRPLASSLVFGEGNGDDGYLRVDEIFGLDLSADLIVLSGCSTGLGRFSGDGIFGLTRAFIFAGTPSVVVSNWDVSDRATAFLMDRFYGARARGSGKARALAEAQRATRAVFPHPALWAAFVLIGEPE